MKPYGLAADLHLHAWKQFNTTNDKGVSSRLEILLVELYRLWAETDKAGGNRIVLAGDLFHVRGAIAPSVLNPTKVAFRALRKAYPHIDAVIIAGNHDMEFRESSDMGNAVEAVDLEGFTIVSKPMVFYVGTKQDLVLVPWIEDVDKLKATLEAFDPVERGDQDLIIHAPIDGVIPGIPAHGLDADYLGKLGFRRVWAGHYHHAKDFGNGVQSIGALAHHTWSDVGTRAGFHVVYEDRSQWFKSHAPQFIDIDSTMTEEDVELLVPGNYVRVKTASTKTAELNKLREWLEKCGSKAVLIQHVPEATVTRTASATVKAAVASTLEASVGGYVGETFKADAERVKRVNEASQKILAETNAR